MDFCEAAGFLYIPAFNMDETPQDMADFIEYVNGPADTAWGQQRGAADGHPAPYRLRYLELGNEERVDEQVLRQSFQAMAEAVWAVDPGHHPGRGRFRLRPADHRPVSASRARRRGSPAWPRTSKILRAGQGSTTARSGSTSTSTPTAPAPRPALAGVPTYIDALDKIAGGARHKVVGVRAQFRQPRPATAPWPTPWLSTLQSTRRRPCRSSASANGLQPDGQNDNGWDQGLAVPEPVASLAAAAGLRHAA